MADLDEADVYEEDFDEDLDVEHDEDAAVVPARPSLIPSAGESCNHTGAMPLSPTLL